jgi:hypothetical protein
MIIVILLRTEIGIYISHSHERGVLSSGQGISTMTFGNAAGKGACPRSHRFLQQGLIRRVFRGKLLPRFGTESSVRVEGKKGVEDLPCRNAK